MTGARAALKVARRNALRNRRRTTFLVLLVAVSVALGIVVAGVVRTGSPSPEEAARREIGAADAVVQVRGGDEVVEWVRESIAAVEPALSLTDFRQTGVPLDGFGFTAVSDLDLDHPLTEGMMSLVDGRAPSSPGEAAASVSLAEAEDFDIGDRVELEGLDVGAVEIVGLVADPVTGSGAAVVLSPGALAGTTSDATVLAGGEGAEAAAARLNELWSAEGRRSFWPEPAVDPVPEELRSLDPEVYAFLTATEIEDLVELARTGDPELVSTTAMELVYGSGRPFTVDVHAETRAERFAPSIETRPGLVSTGASTLLLIEVGFITGAAFAAGTRRRLREIGLLAAGGASERHIRITVIGEGLTTGVLGASLGVLLGLGALVAGRPVIERIVDRPVTSLGLATADVVGPVVVALVAVLLAVATPARTASRIPVTSALQGRMPASAPRRWVVPAGVLASALGAILVTVAMASTSRLSPVLVAAGGVVAVGGVAMLAGSILDGLSRLADRAPATGRLVLRDSGRHRARSAVAVAATMVILLAPVILATMHETTRRQDLLAGLPEPENHLLLTGIIDQEAFTSEPITDEAVAAVADVVPERRIATFEAIDVEVRTRDHVDPETASAGADVVVEMGPELDRVAVASPALLDALGDERVRAAIGAGRIVVLGVEDRETTVSLGSEEMPAVEVAVPVVRWSMPRVLLPGPIAAQYEGAVSRPMALFVLDRPLTDEETSRLAGRSLEMSGGRDHMSGAAVYAIGAGATFLAVLLVIALVTAVSAAEVDEELTTIVAVGAPGSFRRRFLGLLTGYQALIGAALAIPLGLGLMKVFASARTVTYLGPFGQLRGSELFVPPAPLLALGLLVPPVVGLLTSLTVRSAPVTPPRRAT